MKNKHLVIIFLLIIFGVFLSYPISYILVKTNIITLNSTDNFQSYENIKENNIIDKINNKTNSIKTSLENTVTNYFPFYFTINNSYQNINYDLNKLIYNKNIPLKTNSDGEYVFYNKKDNLYFIRTKYSNKELNKRLNKQVSFFNSLSNKSIDLYIYIPSRYELTTIDNNNLASYIDKFKSKLNNNIHVDNMKVTNINEYKTNFYLTDHHWNMSGALKGYNDITKLLNVEKIDDLKIITNNSRKYYGSLAKSSITDLNYDYISDVKINLDYSKTIEYEKDNLEFKPRKLKLDKKDNKYYDYYVQYFNGQYGKIIYDYNNIEKDNLLIMSDSFAWQIDYLIAASFNKTHVINLRYDEYKNNTFNLTEYIKDNDISKVLFLYEGESILFDQYDYDFLGRVK